MHRTLSPGYRALYRYLSDHGRGVWIGAYPQSIGVYLIPNIQKKHSDAKKIPPRGRGRKKTFAADDRGEKNTAPTLKKNQRKTIFTDA